MRTVKQFLTYVNGAPFQPAVAQVLAPAESSPELAPACERQRDLLCDGLAELGFDVIRPQATYFATVDVGTDGVEFCRELPRRAGVVAIPSSVFYDIRRGRPATSGSRSASGRTCSPSRARRRLRGAAE